MSSGGLRGRRRRQTRIDIHAAALRLARDRGVDKVTIDEISEAAGVSARTFFNYFPSKESAIAHAPLDIPEDMAADFVAAGPAANHVLLGELIRLIMRSMTENPPSREELADVFAVGHSSAAVASAILTQFDQFQVLLGDLVAQRTGVQRTDEVPALVAALALAVARNGIMRWATHTPGGEDDGPLPHIQRSADLIDSFFGDAAR